MIKEISITTKERVEFIDITDKINELVTEINEGAVVIFVPHTTAAVTVNENADPNVMFDIKRKLKDFAPEKDYYSHQEGNSDAHIKASLFGNSLTLIIKDGKLMLHPSWMGVFFCEFDGPRERKVIIQCNT